MSFNLAKCVVLCRALAEQRVRVMKPQLDREHHPLVEICLGKAEAALNITDVFDSRASRREEGCVLHSLLASPASVWSQAP